jgi:hypothetical protein
MTRLRLIPRPIFIIQLNHNEVDQRNAWNINWRSYNKQFTLFDNTVLILNTEEHLQELMNIINTQSIRKSELRQDRNNDGFQKRTAK